jgi:ParB family transcriptional regulator, chromosome partitioning protein
MTAATHTNKSKNKAPSRALDAPEASGLGVGSFGDLSSLLDEPTGAGQATGEPIELLIENVEEDPNQPRQKFEEGAMVELTESIALHGVKVPIQVHRHPEIAGRYIIDEGARRLRCSIRAGKPTIPAVVGEKFSLVEQLVVNKVRDDTPPKDKAMAFARLMKENGWTQRQLSEKSKLSEAYVSQHMALLNLPAPVDAVFTSGRCADVTVINELAKAYKKNGDAVEAWLADADQEITRGTVKLLREFLDDKRKATDASDDGGTDDGGATEGGTEEKGGKEPKEKTEKEPDPDKIKKAIILGIYKKRAVRLMTNKRWSAEGFAWVKYEDNGEEIEIELDQLKLNRLIEA